MKTVLVTAIGSFSADAVIKGCREYGLRVIGTDIYPKEWLSEGNEVEGFYQIPRADAGTSYMDALRKIIRDEEVSFVIPLTDAEIDVLNGNRELILPAKLLLSSEKSVFLFRDKMQCAAAVQEVQKEKKSHFKTIPSASFCGEGSSPFDFPVILKPVDGRSSEGMYRVSSPEEWNLAAAAIAARNKEKTDYMVQPVIRGNIVTADVVRDGFGNCAVLPREELLRTLNGAGLSVHVFRDAGLEEICRAIAGRLNVLGCVNMEFIRTEEGDYYFLECNAHFSGGTAFSRASGFNTVTDHLRALEGGKIEGKLPESGGWLVKKYVEVKTKWC